MANSYLARTVSSGGNQKTWTLSVWLKRSALTDSMIFSYQDPGSTGRSDISFASNKLYVSWNPTGSSWFYAKSSPTRLFRDTNAWYHLVVACDTTQATNTNRLKIYINGEQVGSDTQDTYPTQDSVTGFNANGFVHEIGRYAHDGSSSYYDGYMSHFAWVDGQALAPTVFGQTDSTSGIWKFKSPSGVTWGTNGFHLKFENSGNLGLDSSGQTNNYTSGGNLKQALDTPSNIYATLNVLNVPTSNAPTFENGATASTTSSSGSGKFGGSSTLGMTSGKWYCEARAKIPGTSRNVFALSGAVSLVARNNNTFLSDTDNSIGWYSADGTVAYNNSNQYTASTYANDDILMIAVDMDNLKVYLGKNGTWQNSGVPTSGSTGTGAITIAAASSCHDGAYFFCFSDDTSTSAVAKFEYNFGNGFFGTTAITSAGSNGNGSLFEYDVPSGYYALNTKNLNTYG